MILSLLSSGTKRRATQKAASFKTQGILAPLLVRELEESKYEVVAGARRLRAAKLAELEKLPVRVVKLTDADFHPLSRQIVSTAHAPLPVEKPVAAR